MKQREKTAWQAEDACWLLQTISGDYFLQICFLHFWEQQ